MSVDPVAAGQCFVDSNVWLYAVIEDAGGPACFKLGAQHKKPKMAVELKSRVVSGSNLNLKFLVPSAPSFSEAGPPDVRPRVCITSCDPRSTRSPNVSPPSRRTRPSANPSAY